jgi:hypothetical protein
MTVNHFEGCVGNILRILQLELDVDYVLGIVIDEIQGVEVNNAIQTVIKCIVVSV